MSAVWKSASNDAFLNTQIKWVIANKQSSYWTANDMVDTAYRTGRPRLCRWHLSRNLSFDISSKLQKLVYHAGFGINTSKNKNDRKLMLS